MGEIIGLKSTWTLEGASADNTALTKTKAAEVGRRHYVTGVFVATDAALTDGIVVTVKDGATVIGQLHLRDRRDLPLPAPLEITAGAAFEISIPAAGLGIASSIFVTGFTV